MQAVEHPVAPVFPPFTVDLGKRNCYVVLRDVFDRIHINHLSSQHEKEMNEMVFSFIIQLMEDSCAKNFLKAREREKLKASLNRRHLHMPSRKRSKEEESLGLTDIVEKPHYTIQLPSDYLLRFFAALPLLVDTFLNFCGGGVDTSLLGGLWELVETCLKELERSNVFYSPALDYQP
jgi:hypothetical protein